jgi:ribonucleoside-diphosphate reductase subunit M2
MLHAMSMERARISLSLHQKACLGKATVSDGSSSARIPFDFLHYIEMTLLEHERDEPILRENPDRFSLFPIQYDCVWDHYKTAMAAFWVSEEVDTSQDTKDWESLKDDEKHFLSMVLAFFAQSDAIVNENLGVRFMNEVQIPEARAFYGFQIAMENVHNEMYNLLIDTYVKDPQQKNKLFRAIDNFPSIKRKADWALRWIESDSSFAHRLVAFACIEGIFFSGSFAAIFYFKKRGLLPGLCTANAFISADEGSHTRFACHMYSLLNHKLLGEDVRKIVTEAVDIEREFICDSLPCAIIGMNAADMQQYIEFVADHLIVALGYDKIYNVDNSLPYMDQISLQGKSNFFERRESSYRKCGVGIEGSSFVFDKNCDF